MKKGIRKKAEDLLKSHYPVEDIATNKKLEEIIHELQVHQVELEMQNEELQQIRNELEASRNKYADLYDFAPVGYFTIDGRNSKILAVNLTGAGMIGVERRYLIGRSIDLYIASESQYQFYTHRQQVMETGTRQTCELNIRCKNYTNFYAYLESIRVKNGDTFQIRTVLIDITERIQTERKLDETQQRLAAIFDNALDTILLTNDEGNYIDANPAARDLLGYTHQELLQMSYGDLTPTLQRDEGQELWQKFLSEKNLSGEYQLCRKDGGMIDVEFHAVTNIVPGVHLSIIRDITQRKKAERELKEHRDHLEELVNERTIELKEANKKIRESQHFIQQIADMTPDIIYVYDLPNLKNIYSNNQIKTILGYTPEEVRTMGQKFYDLLHPDDLPKVSEKSQQLHRAKDDQILHTEYRMKRADGEWRWLRSRELVFTRTEDGSPQQIIGVTQDITTRKQREDQIKEQAALLDKATDAIMVRDLEYRIIYWNKSAEGLYGWTSEEIIGKDCRQYICAKNNPSTEEVSAIVLEKGEWQGELNQLTKSGKEIIVQSRKTLVLDDQKQPKSILIINTDITEKKQLETQFLRAQRMEGIGTLAGGIAHDLNNILTPLSMAFNLFREKLTDDSSVRMLDLLEKNVARGSDLIRQVLAFARGMEGKKVVLQSKYIANEMIKILRETFPKTIKIKKHFADDLYTIVGDPTQLHQVLLNFCVNARDAMPDGGVLKITIENTTIDEHFAAMNLEAKPGNYVLIKVSDTGSGISPENIDKIFEPFFTTKPMGEGTGLGLSTTLAIVRSHGGFIVVHSKVGEGTTFEIYLPAAEKNQVKVPIFYSPDQIPKGHGESILIVEDETAILEITQKVLTNHGYQILTAKNGLEAIEIYQRHQNEIQLVITDMMMPIMTGFDEIKTLKNINPQIKIIAISGLVKNEQITKKAKNYIQAFLMKPYTSEQLIRAVYDVIHAK